MAPHSSTLTWKIPWTEEPGRLQSMGSLEENNRMDKIRDHFKKIRDTKGTFHAKMSTIKDRNGMGQRSNPCSRKIPPASRQLSPCAVITEPALWSP